MAIQSFQLDPGHKHNYRKVIQLGSDDNFNYSAPSRTTVTDDAEVKIGSGAGKDLEAVGLTVATLPTSAPV